MGCLERSHAAHIGYLAHGNGWESHLSCRGGELYPWGFGEQTIFDEGWWHALMAELLPAPRTNVPGRDSVRYGTS